MDPVHIYIYIKYIYVSIQKYINNLKHHHIREPVKIQVIKEQFPAGVPPFLIQGCRQEAYRIGERLTSREFVHLFIKEDCFQRSLSPYIQ
jgi:hypothetical protein